MSTLADKLKVKVEARDKTIQELKTQLKKLMKQTGIDKVLAENAELKNDKEKLRKEVAALDTELEKYGEVDDKLTELQADVDSAILFYPDNLREQQYVEKLQDIINRKDYRKIDVMLDAWDLF